MPGADWHPSSAIGNQRSRTSDRRLSSTNGRRAWTNGSENYLVQELELERIGHVRTQHLSNAVPFRNGEPRRPIRVYANDERDRCVVLGEAVVPVWAAETVTDAVVEWLSATAIDEVTVLHGIPFPHGPDEHAVFSIATPAYQRRRLTDTDSTPLRGGVLDGIPGEFTIRQLDGTCHRSAYW